MRIAIVGCGYVADLYVQTLPLHPELELVGVTDRDPRRAEAFSKHYSLTRYESLDDLLKRSGAEIVLNLTNPRSHFEVTRTCLEAGKHVYSEKPLAMQMHDARRLVDMAAERGLYLSSAPCSLLGESAQTIWKALRENVVGPVRIVYAELDDGPVHQMAYQKWVSASGVPWPYQDEFETGCTLEHAGYYLTWLAAFFGPAETVTAFASCAVPDKGTAVPLQDQAPDFSLACIRFASGVVARLTCSIIAPHDHSLRIVGDRGVLSTDDCWFYRSKVHVQRWITVWRKTLLNPWKSTYPLVGKANALGRRKGAAQMDFSRGVAELAGAITEKRPCRLPADFCLHVNEIVLGIHHATEFGACYRLSTSFQPPTPMPWAQ